MNVRPISGPCVSTQMALLVVLSFALGAAARAQQAPANAARVTAAAQARHLAPIPPPHFPAPVHPAQPIQPLAPRPLGQPVPAAPVFRPHPLFSPAARPMGVPPIPPSGETGAASPLPPRPLGLAPIEIGPPSVAPFPASRVLPVRPPVPPADLPNPAPNFKPYCSPLSIVYNTGSICFDPDLFTLDPQYLPWGLYVFPPQIGANGQFAFSPLPPPLLLEYCPNCALVNAGLRPAYGLPHPISAPPSLASRVSAAPSGPPVILVLKSGERALVARYWLGSDWLLHYVSVDGQRGAIALNELNLTATGDVNFQRGVVFSMPAWPNP